jgi:hypothetical protein
MLNLIKRIIDLATEKVVSLIDLTAVSHRASHLITDKIDADEVREQAVQNLVNEGIDYNSLAGEFDMSELAGEFSVDEIADNIDKSDVARAIAEDRDLVDSLGNELRYHDRFMDRLVEQASDSIKGTLIEDDQFLNSVIGIVREEFIVDERIDTLSARVEALEKATPATEPTVEVSGALTDRLLSLAVERLLMLADEAVREGKV